MPAARFVYVQWVDHFAACEHLTVDEVAAHASHGYLIETVGFPILENDDILVLAASLSIPKDGGEVKGDHNIFIYKSCITQRKDIRLRRTKKTAPGNERKPQ